MPDTTDTATLCVSRKSGQAIIIDGTIRVEVELSQGRILVRTTAPRSVRVLREELFKPQPQTGDSP